MSLSFQGAVVLITGAGSGLGRQLALQLAHKGAIIAAVDLHAEPLRALIDEVGGAWAVADVTDQAGMQAAVGALQDKLGPIDMLIANAGIACETPAAHFRPADVEAVVRVNLLGVANSIGAVLPEMLARGRGHLVAVSSLASYRGMWHGAGYCASKAGVNALVESLRLEVRPLGIRCTTVCPGWIRTPLAQRFTLPKPGTLSVEKAARRIVRAIERGKRFDAFPLVSRLGMSLLGWLPTGLADSFVRRYFKRNERKQAARRARRAAA